MPIPTNIERKVGDFLVSKTDTRGIISYCNDEFIAISGYSEAELLGKPHSIVRHPDMPKTIFKYLWDRLREGNEVNAFVKNMAKDGSFYWVFANVVPSYSGEGKLLAYTSVRRRPSEDGVYFAKQFYPELLKAEANGGVEAGFKFIKAYMADYQNASMTDAAFCLQVPEVECICGIRDVVRSAKTG
ncbi:PAS domain-containing protein [Campylobacter troglodytis]|uniref:PAS domain-containing protein n=1 Tax=Campylobacter troglodytis TaxID=654363 RepID=UPI0011591DC5|nr:PAS domain-containing protein [Campylobacter troglodytis]TQR60262.1 PAS sensor protein [Campylobacter troglodytis]